jgi:prophage antirepressor-like protein
MAATVPYSVADGIFRLGGEVLVVINFEDDPEVVWINANPVHIATGAKNITQTMYRVDDEDKSSLKDLVASKGLPKLFGLSDTPPNHADYNEGKAIYVNECGLYAIILGSKKPEMKAFKHWVMSEVLPEIRRTGGYKRKADNDDLPIAKWRCIETAVAQQLSLFREEQTSQLSLFREMALSLQTSQTSQLDLFREEQTSQLSLFREMALSLQTSQTSQTSQLDLFRKEQTSQLDLFRKEMMLGAWGANITQSICAHVKEVLCSPSGGFLKALRLAIKLPARKSTADSNRFPDLQIATPVEVSLMSATLTEAVFAEIPSLSFSAWKAMRCLIGKRAKKLRVEWASTKPQGDPLRAAKPLLWTFIGGRRAEGGGARYVYLKTHATPIVREVLLQAAPFFSGRTVESIRDRVIFLSSTLPAEDWPVVASELEPSFNDDT